MESSDLDTTVKSTPAWQTILGLVLTAFWLIVAALYIRAVWPLVLAMKPDEFATFLGGVFAPLAFLWLVVGYFQQGEELRHSVEALRLQSVELRSSVEQQKGLVEATREQIDHERSVATATEAAAVAAAAPLFRFTKHVTQRSESSVYAEYRLFNVGNRCTDFLLEMTPVGIRSLRPVFDTGDVQEYALQYERAIGASEQTISMTYRDIRGNEGIQTLKLGIEQQAGEGAGWQDEAHRITS